MVLRRFSLSAVISIHTLCMEGDLSCLQLLRLLRISIHTLRMEGDVLERLLDATNVISIHTLRMEGDVDISDPSVFAWSFQSTPSAWRVTIKNPSESIKC